MTVKGEGMSVTVKTDGEIFINFRNDPVFVLIKKTGGDSPNCQSSWTYGAWLGDRYIDGTCDEASLEGAVEHASESIAEIARVLTEMSDYLRSYKAYVMREMGVEV